MKASGQSDEVFTADQSAIERDLQDLQQLFMNHSYIKTNVPKTKGGFITFVLFLFPFRFREPKQLQ